MENLRLVGNEENQLIFTNEAGQRFALQLDDSVRNELRSSLRSNESKPALSKVRPREIQSQIRAGLTANEVAELLSIPLEDVTRFEGPILAERQHMVNQALAVPVLSNIDLDPDQNHSFGSAIRQKLEEYNASQEQWNSWKDETGWTIQLKFVSNEIHHDARWRFEARHSAITALNTDAKTLSKHGASVETLIPKLRALDTPQVSDEEQNRFNSDAFGPRHLELAPEVADTTETHFVTAPLPQRSDPAVTEAAIKRAPNNGESAPSNTADLLDALRKRRGQRQSPPEESESYNEPVSLFEAVIEKNDANANSSDDGNRTPKPQPPKKRGNRTSLPSWDEIVFGAKSDNSDD